LKEDSSYDPGSVLLERYRIASLIGEGGMGEVYKAEDLTLGQQVALKFLPADLVEREDLKRRFHEEVRIARRVTHRNVARVHDIAEVDGRPFLSMEYVDGEDLSQLLRQIGRLPREKALDIARQICAGLSAAHESGVLHRDLKPANVLLDRAGKVHLTDFGLAVLAEEQVEGGVVGTPAYMAPEQINGGRIDERSEVYSLGLLLYELFTGKRAFDGRSFEELRTQHAQSTPLTPTSVLADMDPGVERVILQCLEKDPEERPASVKAVAWALPGGDPLAAALAAGETPPPELVAAANVGTGLDPKIALVWLVVTLACLAGVLGLAGRTRLPELAGLELAPSVLEARARDVLALCGERPEAADRTRGFMVDDGALEALAAREQTPERWERLADEDVQPILFWYRESVVPIQALNPGRLGASFSDPPQTTPGMTRVVLDGEGRLRSFSIVPPSYDEGEGPWEESDWSGFFAAAGLDREVFEPVSPRWTPAVGNDRRFAWEAPAVEGGERPLRVEASSFRGRPNSFSVVMPWVDPPDPPRIEITGTQVLVFVLLLVVLAGGGLIARRNYRLGRGDMKGALRLGLVVLSLRFLAWLFGAHHLPLLLEFNVFLLHIALGLLVGAFVWMFYLALEPYFRRLWPQRLVSWVRVLGGRVRDPLVGRDVLVGVLFGLLLILVGHAYLLLSEWLGYPPPRPDKLGSASSAGLEGLRFGLSAMFLSATGALTTGLIFSVVLLVLRIVLRVHTLAVLGLFLVGMFLFSPEGGYLLADRAVGAVSIGLFLVVLLRFGLLAAVIAVFTTSFLGMLPLTADLSLWYAPVSLLGVGAALTLALFGFFTSLGGQALFRDTVFERAGAPG